MKLLSTTILCLIFSLQILLSQKSLHQYKVNYSSRTVKGLIEYRNTGYVNDKLEDISKLDSVIYPNYLISDQDLIVSKANGNYFLHYFNGDTLITSHERKILPIDSLLYLVKDSETNCCYVLREFPNHVVFDSLKISKYAIKPKAYGYKINYGMSVFHLLTKEKSPSLDIDAFKKSPKFESSELQIIKKSKSYILVKVIREVPNMFNALLEEQIDSLFFNRKSNYSDKSLLKNKFQCVSDSIFLRKISNSKGNYGIIDELNRVVIDPRYKQMYRIDWDISDVPIYDGCLFIVENEQKKKGIINLNNELIIDLMFKKIELASIQDEIHFIVTSFYKNPITKKYNMGIFDSSGVIVLDTVYKRIEWNDDFKIYSKNDGKGITKGKLGKTIEFELTKGYLQFSKINEKYYRINISYRENNKKSSFQFNADLDGIIYLPNKHKQVLINNGILKNTH